jgi:hypothetical protein
MTDAPVDAHDLTPNTSEIGAIVLFDNAGWALLNRICTYLGAAEPLARSGM